MLFALGRIRSAKNGLLYSVQCTVDLSGLFAPPRLSFCPFLAWLARLARSREPLATSKGRALSARRSAGATTKLYYGVSFIDFM